MDRKRIQSRLLVWMAVFLLAGGGITGYVLVELRDHESKAYVEPAVIANRAVQQAVIVTAVDTQTAKQAIMSVGGEVTSNLWLIEAAGGLVPTAQIEALAHYPGVTVIAANKGVESASDNDLYSWEGWVTDRRNYDEGTQRHELMGDMFAPPIALPDGGVFAVVKMGEALILNGDGSERVRLDLNAYTVTHPFRTPAIVDPISSTIYIASDFRAYAIEADGDIEWVVTSTNSLKGGLALGNNVLYAADQQDYIYGLDLSDGSELWSFSQGMTAGRFLAPPIVAQVGPYSGTMYVVSRMGHLTALDENGGELWTSIFPAGDPYQLSPQVDMSGTVYIAGNQYEVYAVEPVSGTTVYQYTTPGKIEAQPALAHDGQLYIATKNGYIIGLDANGNERFNVQPVANDLIDMAPMLSADETVLYVTLEKKKLLAIDTNDGSLLWQHTTEGDLWAGPVVAANGNIHIGDRQGIYEIIRASDGFVLYRYDDFDEFRQSPTLSRDEGGIFFHDRKMDLVALTRLPNAWDSNKPHVEVTGDPNLYKVANPVSIDMGADIAHLNGVTGAGVTVAVVDSGVHFDDTTESTLGVGKKAQYLGQADFVGPGRCDATGPSPDPCFTGYMTGTTWISSSDNFGHGSHVAGIIWNEVQDYYTGASLGMAPDVDILSVRVLGDDGTGTYEDVIEGIQYVVSNTLDATFDVGVMNLSISGYATSPYFVDPLNRAVEEAWAAGIVVVAAAGNNGPAAETITVPGNDPYVITVGSLNSNRTPGYWADDTLSTFSSTGPTRDGFIKPDILVPGGNVVSYMDGLAGLVQTHPDYDIATMRMFRMNGTSMATAVASGVVALILEEQPTLTPDQVKFRLLYTAKTAIENDAFAYSPLRQGLGRVWVPDAVFETTVPLESANTGMDINDDLAYPWQPGDDPDPVNNPDLAHHYQGPVQTILSDSGDVRLYYVEDESSDDLIALGASMHEDGRWLNDMTLTTLDPTFNDGQTSWGSGSYLWSGGSYLWSGGSYLWSGGSYLWSGGSYLWSGGSYLWSGGSYLWSGGSYLWSGGSYLWSGGIDPVATGATTTSWIDDVMCDSTAVSVNSRIGANSGDVTLLWAEHPLNGNGYEVHRSQTPYFIPHAGTVQAIIAPEGVTLYEDSDIVTMNRHHFYVIRARNCDDTSIADSDLSGRFTFSVSP